MKIEEAFRMTIDYGYIPYAHYIFYMLQKGMITMNDDDSKIDFYSLSDSDHQEVARMIESNFLGIKPIYIYSLKVDKQNFVFIFAKDKQDAIKHFEKVFRKPPLNCFQYDLDFEILRGNKAITFKDMRNEHTVFPAIAGFYEKENKVLVS